MTVIRSHRSSDMKAPSGGRSVGLCELGFFMKYALPAPGKLSAIRNRRQKAKREAALWPPVQSEGEGLYRLLL